MFTYNYYYIMVLSKKCKGLLRSYLYETDSPVKPCLIACAIICVSIPILIILYYVGVYACVDCHGCTREFCDSYAVILLGMIVSFFPFCIAVIIISCICALIFDARAFCMSMFHVSLILLSFIIIYLHTYLHTYDTHYTSKRL